MKFDSIFTVKDEIRKLWLNPDLATVFSMQPRKRSIFLSTNPNLNFDVAIKVALLNSDKSILKDLENNPNIPDLVVEKYKLAPINSMIGKIAKKLKESGYSDMMDSRMRENIESSYIVRNPDNDDCFQFYMIDDGDDVTLYIKRFTATQEDVWNEFINNKAVFVELTDVKLSELPEDFQLTDEIEDFVDIEKDVEGQTKFEWGEEYTKWNKFKWVQDSIRSNNFAYTIYDLNSYGGYFDNGSPQYKIPDDFDDFMDIF